MKSNPIFSVSCVIALLMGSIPFFLPNSYQHYFTVDSSQSESQNTPPVVQILAPVNNDFFEWNSQIRYSIRVSDQEDGESEFQEIVPNEILLEVVYLPDPSQAENYVNNDSLMKDPPGLALIRTSDCFNCHAVKSNLTGPPFAAVAKKYSHNAASVTLLAERVVRGHSGVWGSEAMPPHPDFTQAQAEQIVQWIFRNTADLNRDYYPGKEGAFRTITKPETGANGVYIITASYTDHGPEGTERRGHHSILLRSKQ